MSPITKLPLRLAAVPSLSRSLLRPALGLQLVRQVSTVKATSAQEQDTILVAQRKNRPCSPHLQIYQPQLTWILSSFHRITGVGLAVGFYALTCSYAFGSLLGYPIDTASLVGLVAGLPVALKIVGKAIAAFPFAFHVGNGFRHLAWDFGSQLSIKGVYTTGYIVLGFTAAVGSYLAFLA
ncbi:unnamed protein product [Ambrosiozyma monospora]|uniref:Unnamed protein product n=1 Tax=Ambrosiozyma monospora TaxID=43982 RepID=A0ACB5SVY4_AMBMO|nr:unnamed protein product [Ambrosiozyma monospora]